MSNKSRTPAERSRVRTGPLWAVTLVFSGMGVVGALAAYDQPTAQMFALVVSISIPAFSALHAIAGRTAR